jgi:hypothetical protein
VVLLLLYIRLPSQRKRPAGGNARAGIKDTVLGRQAKMDDDVRRGAPPMRMHPRKHRRERAGGPTKGPVCLTALSLPPTPTHTLLVKRIKTLMIGGGRERVIGEFRKRPREERQVHCAAHARARAPATATAHKHTRQTQAAGSIRRAPVLDERVCGVFLWRPMRLQKRGAAKQALCEREV